MNDTPTEWDAYLDPGEVILWQGRPSQRLQASRRAAPLVLFGLAFGGFALGWIWLVAQAGGYFWVFGLPFLLLGLIFSTLAPVIGPLQRRATWYTLTNRRAFIATDLPFLGRRLDDYPIHPGTPLRLEQNGPLGSVYFSQRRITKSSPRARKSPLNLPVGFEMIPDAPQVLTLLQEVQDAAGPAPKPAPMDRT